MQHKHECLCCFLVFFFSGGFFWFNESIFWALAKYPYPCIPLGSVAHLLFLFCSVLAGIEKQEKHHVKMSSVVLFHSVRQLVLITDGHWLFAERENSCFYPKTNATIPLASILFFLRQSESDRALNAQVSFSLIDTELYDVLAPNRFLLFASVWKTVSSYKLSLERGEGWAELVMQSRLS